jgi:hypothetical protein
LAKSLIGRHFSPTCPLHPAYAAYPSSRRDATPLGLVASNVATTPRLRQCAIAKIFPFRPDPNQLYIPHRLVPTEGRIAIVTDAGRDAVDAAALSARRGGRAGFMACEQPNGVLTRDAEADGEVVWF